MSDPILRGAYDLHVHCSPDVVPRAQDLVDLAHAAQAAGMAGIGLKDHTTSTVGRCYALNRLLLGGPRFYSSLTLNPPVGGLNAVAVETALKTGVDIVYFPTYSAKHHIDTLGPLITPVPHPRSGVVALSVLDERNDLKTDVRSIIDLIAEFDGVLATGHLSQRESLVLLRQANQGGVRRMVVTHASESVPNMSVADQRIAVQNGAMIEHCFMAATSCCPGQISLEEIAQQINAIGVEHIILSSDFGQPSNGPPVESFAMYLQQLMALGFSEESIRQMIVENPQKLLKGRGE